MKDGSSGYLQVDNSSMTYLLINAVKEQHHIINEQQKQMATQQGQIDFLMKEMNEKKQKP